MVVTHREATVETAKPQWEFKEHGGWKAMSPQVNGILLNFQGEAVAILVEHCTNVRRVYDIDPKRQHRQYYEQESGTWITTASKDIRLVYVAAP